MRIAQLERDAAHLAAQGDGRGSFYQWLELLAVKLPRNISVAGMIEHGWIKPTCRVVIPARYFSGWTRYPVLGMDHDLPDHLAWADLLWYAAGRADGFLYTHFPMTGEWFVHPLERDSEPLGAHLRAAAMRKTFPRLKAEKHPNGNRFFRWIDYFPHWKGYEVIDVLRVAKLIGGVWCVRGSKAVLRSELRHHARRRKWCMGWVGKANREWNDRRRTFDPLSRYREMRAALTIQKADLRSGISFEEWEVKDAALVLARHLGVNQDRLEKQALPDLLTLAREWRHWEDDDGVGPGRFAWGQLQKDMLHTIEWLHFLTGNSIEHYYDAWANKSRMPRPTMALEDALPVQFRSVETYFLDHFLAVRSAYDKMPAPERLTDAEVAKLVKALRGKTLLVSDWLLSYKRFHEALGGPPKWDCAGVTPNTLVHDFLLIALFAEKILEALSSKPGQDPKQLAKEFCQALEAKDARFVGTWKLAGPHWAKYTNLRTKPSDPFGDLLKLNLTGSPPCVQLARAMLFFGLTRNYFGHHSYLDDTLFQSVEGGAALSGVLSTTLYLTAVPCGVR